MADADVSVRVIHPVFGPNFGTSRTNTSGEFTYEYDIYLVVGTYHVYATDGVNSAETIFTDAKIWTTRDDCGSEAQDVNHFVVGEQVYINGQGFSSGNHYWEIRGKPGSVSCDPNIIVANGTYFVNASGNFCFAAYTVQVGDCGEYSVKFSNKNDNYQVVECLNDAHCNYLDRNYCEGTLLMHVEGVCARSGPDKDTCVDGTPIIVQNCNDGLYCNGVETCVVDSCVAGTAVDCSDNLFCTVNERCDESTDSCIYDQRDCSAYNIPGIATCTNNPDDNPLTWDYRAVFVSACDEDLNVCTSGSSDITHTCSISSCSAECDSNDDCETTDCDYLDGCHGNDYYDYSDVSNSCTDSCVCTHNACGLPTVYTNDQRCTCAGDEDGDGVYDCYDKCPGSRPNEPVDADGCDPFQFCEKFYCGGCEYADFNNNEPGKELPHDCTLVIIYNEGAYLLKCLPTVALGEQCFN